MTGRGDGRLMHPNPNPSVTIGISLSTSPSTLSTSTEDPFYVVVTARILSSPRPEQPIILLTHLSPLHALNTRAFENIKCTTDEAKHIEIRPRGWPQYHWDPEDMRSVERFVTIPPRGQCAISVRHQVPDRAISDARVEQGERYKVKMTDSCLGTLWWTFGALEDLEGKRLCSWRSPAEEEADAEEERALLDDPELKEEIKQEKRDKYGDRPTFVSEKPDMLAFVLEVGEVEFDVV